MSNCLFTLNIDGHYQEFRDEESLNSFLRTNKKQLVGALLTEKAVFSLDKSEQQKSVDLIEAMGSKLSFVPSTHTFSIVEGDDVIELTSVTKTISQARVLGKRLVPEFIVDNVTQKKKDELLTILDENNQPKYTPMEADAIIADLKKKWQLQSMLGTSWHEVAQGYFEGTVNSPADIRDNFPQMEQLSDFTLRKYLTSLDAFKAFIEKRHGKDVSYITEAKLFDKEAKIAGISDLIVVDANGKAHIYDYKTSTKSDNDWIAAKKKGIEYQLAFYRQILRRNGVDVESVNYIPVHLNEVDYESMIINDFNMERPIRLQLGERDTVVRNTRRFLPHDITYKLQDVSSNKNVHDFLGEAFNYTQKNIVKKGSNVDDMYKKVLATSSHDGKSYVLYSAFKKNDHKYIPKTATEAEIKAEIEIYLQDLDEWNSKLPLQFYDVVAYAKDKIAKGEPVQLETVWNDHTSTIRKLNNLLHKYIHDTAWRPLENDLLYDLGIVAFENEDTGTVDFISLTANNIELPVDNLLRGNTLLGNFLPNHKAAAVGATKELTNGDIELMKVYALIKNNEDVFKDKKIGAIYTLNMLNNKIIPRIKTQSIGALENQWSVLMKNIPSTLALKNVSWTPNVIDYYDELRDLITDLVADKKLHLSNSRKIEGTVSRLADAISVQERIDVLNRLNADFMDAVDNDLNAIKHERRDIANIITLINSAILQLSNIPIMVEEDMKNFGNIIGENANLSTPDKIRNLAHATVVRLATQAMNNAASDFNANVGKLRDIHAKLYKAKSNAFKVKTIGYNQDIFKNLLQPPVDGKSQLRFKDPDTDNTLLDVEREYIREFLRLVNPIRTKRLIKKFGADSEEVTDFQSSGAFLNVPLMRADMFNAFLGKDFKEFIGDYFRDMINPNNIFNDDEDSNRKMKFQREMFNQFDFLDLDIKARDEQIANSKPSAFQQDLESVLAIYLMTDAKEVAYNAELPKLNAIKTLTMFNDINAYEDTPNTAKAIEDYIATTMFGKTLIAGESESITKVAGVVKDVSSMAIMAASPASGVTELFTGLWGNIVRLGANGFDDSLYGKEDFRRAMLFAIGDISATNKMSLENISICDSLNEMFRISEMDMRQLAHEVQITSSGLKNFKNKYMYWFNSFPSYLHRMNMFAAQMVKDGVLKLDAMGRVQPNSAIQMKDGKMTYDPKLDDRFSLYLANPDHAENRQTKEWKESRARYLTLHAALSLEPNGLKANTLARPYDNATRDSMKSLADSVHGNYDSTNKTRFQKTAMGSMVMQFKTWATAKKDRWYLSTSPSEKEGKYIMDYIDGEPVYRWEGKVTEGIYQSIMALGNEIYFNKGNVVKAWEEMTPTQKENFALMIGDLLLFGLLSLLVSILFENIDRDADPLAHRLTMSLNSSTNDLYIGSTMAAFAGQKNPVAIFGWSASVLNDTWGSLMGDEKSQSHLLDNIGVWRTLSPLFEEDE